LGGALAILGARDRNHQLGEIAIASSASLPPERWVVKILARHTMIRTIGLLAFVFTAVGDGATAEETYCVEERAAMVETIRAYARSDPRLVGPKGISEKVLEVLGQTKRHLLIPGETYCSVAYADRPIAIGHGQTMSQPLIVALMTELAEVRPDDIVLEIGTGSGYQAAILSPLVRKVCTIEIIPSLAETATKRLHDLGYENVSVRVSDGYQGWPECGPFDAIVVTAALGHVPAPLMEQLKIGGRLVMPLGSAHGAELTVIEKIAPGETTARSVAPVGFVPFTRSQN
jgi:protein-L-isoaspartate(D-aspartate) O-methyltransferase